MTRGIIAVFLTILLALPVAARAQDSDRGFIQGLLEDALSAEGRSVRIEGFAGALSSEATIDRITVTDAEGTWVEARDIAMTWSRSALLRRRIEIEAIRIGAVTLSRAPLPTRSLPSPEASAPFSLPELPVSVTLGTLDIARLEIGAALLGEDAVFAVNGSAQLADGEGSADLSVTRQDAPGMLTVSGSFSNATRALTVDLELDEPGGGLVAKQLDQTRGQDLRLTLAGDGTPADFSAQLALFAAGGDRLGGTVRLIEDDGGDQRFEADLGGDLAPLVAPDYRTFLGRDVRLRTNGVLQANGRTTLDTFTLTAAALDLAGSAQIGADGFPTRFDVTGDVIDPTGRGAPIRLPFGDDPLTVTAASLRARFDAASGSGWQLDGDVAQLATPTLDIGRVALRGTGRIDAAQRALDGRITLETEGLAPTDPGLSDALGPRLSAGFDFDWAEAAGFTIRNLSAGGVDYGLTGRLQIDPAEEGLGIVLRPDLTLAADSLARFRALTGQDLGGAATIRLNGRAEPVRGLFDLAIEGSTQDLAVGIAALDPLLAGDGTVSGGFRRDTAGLTVDALRVRSPEAEIALDAGLASDSGNADLTARLRDVGLLVPGLSGGVTLQASADRAAGAPWDVTLQTDGPGASALRGSGTVAPDASTVNMAVNGSVPLNLANPLIPPQSIDGTAQIDLRIDGAPALSAVRGTIRTSGATLALPTLQMALNDIGAQISIAGGQAQVDLTTDLSTGGRVSVSGPVTLQGAFPADLAITLSEGRLTDGTIYDVALDGDLRLTGPLANGPAISGDIVIDGAEIRIPQPGPSFSALEGVRHVNAPADLRRSLGFAGLSLTPGTTRDASGGGLPIDITVTAAERIFVRGRGLDAELGGQLRLTGTTADIVPVGQFDLVRGRLDLLGRRLTLDEGLVALRGSFDPVLRFVASADADGTEVRIIIDGVASAPTLTVSAIPELPQDEALAQLLFGRNVTDLSAFQAVQLGLAIRTLAGQGGIGILDRIRQGLGVDDFDISTDDEGNAQARVGTYLTENVYSNVTVGSGGTSSVSLNLDVSDEVTVRGEVSNSGESSLGVFFERDY